MAEDNHGAQRLKGGSFYGSISRKLERQNAIFTDLQHTAPRKLPAHAHELPFFALLLQGQYQEHYLHQRQQFGPFTLMYRPANIPHQDEIGPQGVKFFEIEIRPQWRGRLAQAGGVIDMPFDDCFGGELLWLGLKLFAELHTQSAADDLQVESLLTELLAGAARVPRERFHDAPQWLRRIVEKLHAEFCSQLTLDELGQEAGVHPVHLSRVFRRCTGEGIGDYVHRLRIREACRQMLVPRAVLADISLRLGFADQSHFTRNFRRITGTTPAAFRTAHAYRPT